MDENEEISKKSTKSYIAGCKNIFKLWMKMMNIPQNEPIVTVLWGAYNGNKNITGC